MQFKHFVLLFLFVIISCNLNTNSRVDCNNQFIFPFEVNNAIDQINANLKLLNVSKFDVKRIWTLRDHFKFENILNYDFSRQTDDDSLSSFSPHNISHECTTEISKLFKAFTHQELWSIRGFKNIFI